MRIDREHNCRLAENLSLKKQYLCLSMFPLYFILAGLLTDPLPDILTGLYRIISEPDLLITDYVEIGGPGAALVNAGIVTLVCILILYSLGMAITGQSVASLSLMMGFSLFGKNIVNIWAIIAGVAFFAFYHKEHLSRYIYIGFYGTSLSPIITQIVRHGQLSGIWNLVIGILVSIIVGFVLPPLAMHLYHTHQGYCLYNVGFAAGITATIVASLFTSYGMELETRTIWSTGNNVLFLKILLGFFLLTIAAGFLIEKNMKEKYLDILWHPGISGTDYLIEEGPGATMLNMGINGTLATIFVVAVGSDLNGPTIGGILTIAGFSAIGKHIRNIVPVMAGVLLAELTGTWEITQPAAILAALFSTTLAPIAGEFGVFWGVAAGFLHASVAQNVGVICGGMNLYNNGFAGGLVASFLVPVIRSVRNGKRRIRNRRRVREN